MEETPEEVLARLQRYADAMRARGQIGSAAPGFAPAPSAPSPAGSRSVDGAVMTAAPPESRHSFSVVSRTIAGQVICVATCAVTLLLWVKASHAVTYGAVLGAASLSVVGLIRRVPFAGWVLVGLACGLLLGRFS
jgi:hypothetical protein